MNGLWSKRDSYKIITPNSFRFDEAFFSSAKLEKGAETFEFSAEVSGRSCLENSFTINFVPE